MEGPTLMKPTRAHALATRLRNNKGCSHAPRRKVETDGGLRSYTNRNTICVFVLQEFLIDVGYALPHYM
eukprot:5097364-Amphidinium_carterae.1